MAGWSEIIIGIIILNVLFRVIRSLTAKPKVTTTQKPRPRVQVKMPPTARPEEPDTLEAPVEKVMGAPGTTPPAPAVLGEEEKSWVEDLFETVEREFTKKEAPAYDELPSYDERAAAEMLEKAKLKKTVEPTPVRKEPAKRLIKARAREEQVASVHDMLGDTSSIRTAVVLATILGPCRAKRRYRPGTRRRTI